MGFLSDVASRVSGFFSKDTDQAARNIAKGAVSARMPTDPRMAGWWGSGLGDVRGEALTIDSDLMARFADYESMEEYPELGAALAVFADDATQTDAQLNRTVWVESSDDNVVKILSDDLLHKRLRLDDEMWEIAYSLCHYGNDYEENLIDESGVIGINYLPAATMRRVEDERGALHGFVQTFSGRHGYTPEVFASLQATRQAAQAAAEGRGPLQGYSARDLLSGTDVPFEPWEVTHYRLRGSRRRSVYGQSVLEPSRWIWRRLAMLEDSAILFRLTKAIERYAFYIDVGDMPAPEAEAMVNRIRQRYKKKRFINPATGKLELRHDPASPDEDFFIPSRNGSDAARIDVVTSPAWQHMEDLDYFRGKMFSSIAVPKGFLNQEQDVNRATLSSQDVRFARAVLRVQRELRAGVGKTCRVHLSALDMDPYIVPYEVRMPAPSSIFELAQLEVYGARADLATRMGEFVTIPWLLSRVFHLPDKEIQEIVDRRYADMVRAAEVQGEGEGKAQAAASKFAPAMESLSWKDQGRAVLKERLASGVARAAGNLRGVSGPSDRDLDMPSSKVMDKLDKRLDDMMRRDVRLASRLASLEGLLHEVAQSRRGGEPRARGAAGR